MNVLLIGGSSSMMDAIIDKLNKNGHRLYVLTGRRDKRFSYKHIFERYDFEYEDDSVKDIFESIKPDMVLFLGAYDTNFSWQRARQDSVHYAAALMNILSAYSVVGKGRFVYFSSQEVFSGSYTNNIRETETVAPKGFKAMVVAQGEEICSNYRKMQGIDIIVLRLDHVYWVPKKGQEEGDPCFQLCLEALKTGSVSASDRNVFSMIYLKDAVELSYAVMTAQQPDRFCYHISSMEEISEKKLAEIVVKEMGMGVTLEDNSVGQNHRLILDNSAYKEEYPFQIFHNYQKGIAKVAGYMKLHSDTFINPEDAGGGWGGRLWHNIKTIFARLLPFAENMICFIPFFMLNNRAVGSKYFDRLDFYLLYVLLFAIVHGQQQAIFSALLAVAGYCFRQMYNRSGFEVLLDYNTYVWMAQLFILGMVVGYMRDQLHLIKTEDEEEIRYLSGKMDDIADINDSNVRMKQNFESQLVNQKDSLGKVYEITSSLELYAPEEVLFYAARVLSNLMDSQDVAIYSVANRNYARLVSSTSREARRLGSSIQYTAMEEMYDEIKEGRVYINRTLNEDFPLMASAVYEQDEMRLVLMLWGIPWQRMTLAEANRLTIIGDLIQNAVLRANRYLEALKNERYLEGTNVLREQAFELLLKAFLKARDQGLTECTLLEILTEGRGRDKSAAILGGRIRQTDYMGMLPDGKLYILLSNTDEENAIGVMERFRNFGFQSQIRGGIAL